MNVEQILTTVYSKEFSQGLFGMANLNDGKGIIIDFWNVPNIPQPTEEQIIAMGTPALAKQYLLDLSLNKYTLYLKNHIDSVAKAKQYDNAISISSYANSTNETWKLEATTFLIWRDAVFNYAINIETEVKAGKITLPSLDNFIAGLPVIQWPN